MDITKGIIVKEEKMDLELDCSNQDSQNSSENIFVCTGIKQEKNIEDSEFSQGVAQDSNSSLQSFPFNEPSTTLLDGVKNEELDQKISIKSEFEVFEEPVMNEEQVNIDGIKSENLTFFEESSSQDGKAKLQFLTRTLGDSFLRVDSVTYTHSVGPSVSAVSFHCINELISDEISVLAFLQYYHLILDKKICKNCNIRCYLVKKGSKFNFKCVLCGNNYSTTPSHFWLAQTRISYETVLLLVFFFLQECTVSQVTSFLGLSNRTTVDWFSYCREICMFDIISNSCKIGGEGKTVEIYESAFENRKYNRGKFCKCRWVFGGVERGSNKCFLIPVEKGDSETISSIIEQNILPGTTIISDCCKAYNDNKKLKNLEVDHSLHFVETSTSTRTNTVEGTWFQVKSQLDSRAGNKKHLAEHLATFLFLKKYQREERFIRFIEAVDIFQCTLTE